MLFCELLVLVFVLYFIVLTSVYIWHCVGCCRFVRITFACCRGTTPTGGGGRLERSHTILHLPEVWVIDTFPFHSYIHTVKYIRIFLLRFRPMCADPDWLFSNLLQSYQALSISETPASDEQKVDLVAAEEAAEGSHIYSTYIKRAFSVYKYIPVLFCIVV